MNAVSNYFIRQAMRPGVQSNNLDFLRMAAINTLPLLYLHGYDFLISHRDELIGDRGTAKTWKFYDIFGEAILEYMADEDWLEHTQGPGCPRTYRLTQLGREMAEMTPEIRMIKALVPDNE